MAMNVKEQLDSIMVELHGATMKQMILDDDLKEGVETRWAKYAEVLAEQRKRNGPPAPRQETLALRLRQPGIARDNGGWIDSWNGEPG